MRRTSMFLATLVLLANCSKKNDPEPQVNENLVVAENDYYPVAIGNYWVYEDYILYDDGTAVKQNIFDSVYISRDTIIRGKSYAILEGDNRPFSPFKGIVDCLRDSLGHVGIFAYSRLTNMDTLHKTGTINEDNNIEYTWWQAPGESSVTVPVGTFTAINAKLKLRVYFSATKPGKEEVYNTYYVKGVGPITKQYNWGYKMNTGERHEKRLVRYRAVYRNPR